MQPLRALHVWNFVWVLLYGVSECVHDANFTTHVISQSVNGARAVYAIDIDGDGDTDVLSASSHDDTIAWYENDGYESFTVHVITSLALGAESVFAIDMDGDGDIDVLSASKNDDTIAWYENNGAEYFTTHTISTTASGARSVYAIDLDGDGDIDVLSASELDNSINWYENNGFQTFSEHTITSSAYAARSVFAVDLDGDGDVDVLSASFNDGKISWYENNGGAGYFTIHVITDAANGAISVFAVDLDGDGDMDVLSAAYNDDTIAWYENNGAQTFTAHTISTIASGAHCIFAIDVDNDGDIDILSALYLGSTVAWYENDGSETFTDRVVTTSANGVRTIFAIDLDGDGDIDILSASGLDHTIAWYENRSPISYTNWVLQSGTSAADNANSLAVDISRGVIYVTGSTYGSMFPTDKGDADVWVAMYDISTGELLAGIQYGSNSYSYGGKITLLPGGETIEVRGRTDGSTTIFPGNGPYFIAIHNASTLEIVSGNQTTSNTGNGPSSLILRGVRYQCGSTTESLYGANMGGNDFWVKKSCDSQYEYFVNESTCVPCSSGLGVDLAKIDDSGCMEQPTGQPSGQPTGKPSHHPSGQPTYQPSGQPTEIPAPPIYSSTSTTEGSCTWSTTIGVNLGSSSHSVVIHLQWGSSSGGRQWLLNIGQAGTGAHHWLYSPSNPSELYDFGVWADSGLFPSSSADLTSCTVIISTYDTISDVYSIFCGEILVQAEVNSAFAITSTAVRFGVTPVSENNFQGCILDAAIYDRVLSPHEVSAIASSFLDTPSGEPSGVPTEYVCRTKDDAGGACCSGNIVIDPTINVIEENAFSGCSGLSAVSMPHIVRVENSAFQSCTSLVTLVMPLVTSVGTFAFEGCVSLTSLDMPLVTSIGNHAFQLCRALTTLELVLDVSLGGKAFYLCTGLTHANLSHVLSIGSEVFRGCTNLRRVYMPMATNIAIYSFYGCTNLMEVNVSLVTAVGNYAFSTCSTLEVVEMPLVTSVGDYAFLTCTSLHTVNMSLVTSLGNHAFQGCSSVTSVLMPRIVSLGDSVFEMCINLHSFNVPGQLQLPTSLTSIGASSFNRCASLHGVLFVPSSVVTVGTLAFFRCTGFYSAPEVEDSGVTTVAGDAFDECCTSIPSTQPTGQPSSVPSGQPTAYVCRTKDDAGGACCLGDIVIDPTVTAIESNAFDGCTGLLSVNMSLITSVGSMAFHGCTGLTRVMMPQVNEVGSSAFRLCSYLTTVTLPLVTSVGDAAFKQCGALSSFNAPDRVFFPNTLKYIGEQAFWGCSGLKGDIFIPSSVTSIRPLAFWSCSGLFSIPELEDTGVTFVSANAFQDCCKSIPSGQPTLVPSTQPSCQPSENPSSKPSGQPTAYVCRTKDDAGGACCYGHIVIDPDVTAISSYAFDGCTGLLTVNMSHVTSVGSRAFRECSGLTIVEMLVVTTIGNNAFQTCHGLLSVYMPLVKTVGNNAFENCNSILKLSMPVATSIGSYAFQSCTSLDNASMPLATSIGGNAFQSCSNLIAVNISQVTNLGPQVFWSCIKLISVDVPLVTKIDSRTFRSCTNLIAVSMPLVTRLGYEAFQDCASLWLISAPFLNFIDYNACKGCSALTSLNFPLVTSLGVYAFESCTKLLMVNMSVVKSVGNYAFSECTSLNVVEMPLVNSLGDSVFELCASLHSFNTLGQLLIPHSLTAIGENAFWGCSGLHGPLFIPSSVVSVGALAFYRCTGITSTPEVEDSGVTTVAGNAFDECCTSLPSGLPSSQPSGEPTGAPTMLPSGPPSGQPSAFPSREPSGMPSTQPSQYPTLQPTSDPTALPSERPSGQPSRQPTELPTDQPTTAPSDQPSGQPSRQPTEVPTDQPTTAPSDQPSMQPSSQPSCQPSGKPTVEPSVQPSCLPSHQPSVEPSCQPSAQPSGQPSRQPSCTPTSFLTESPSVQPSSQPSEVPSTAPSGPPSSVPSNIPTRLPVTSVPTFSGDTNKPSFRPTIFPTFFPTVVQQDPPSIIECKLSNDGSYFQIKYDIATDQAQMRRRFSCDSMLRFPGDSNAVCVWIDYQTISIYPGGYGLEETPELIEIGDVIELVNFKLRAKCPLSATNAECRRWSASMNEKCYLLAPTSPMSPTVAISAPSLLSHCKSYLLDLTASVGSGGRNWARFWVNLTSVSESEDSMKHSTFITNFFQHNYEFFPPTPLKSGTLVGNETYVFTVTLCNFLGACGLASTMVKIAVADSIPNVKIIGSSFRNLVRSEPLVLHSSSFVGTCNGTNRYSNMVYKWSVFDISNEKMLPDLVSKSKNPSKLLLPGFSLDIGLSYSISVIVTDEIFGAHSYSAVEVEVLPSDIVCSVEGGYVQSWRIGDNLELDASNSYDVDTGENNYLNITWACDTDDSTMLDPTFCSGIISEVQPPTLFILSLNASFLDIEGIIGSSFTICLTLTASHNRSTSAEVVITVAPSLAPKVKILEATNKISAAQPTRIRTSVEVTHAVEASWSINDDNVDLAAISLFPSLITIMPYPSTYLVNIAIGGNSLDAGLTYVFTLSIGNASSTTVSVTVVNPPQPGVFTVVPKFGFELQDTFKLFTSKWTDSELPLSYDFGFMYTSNDIIMPIQGKSESNIVEDTLLPGGLGSQNYSLICVASAYNSVNAKSVLTRLVTVEPTLMSPEEFEKVVEAEMLKVSVSSNVDAIKAVISVGVSVLNKANCSLAPSDCSYRGRHDCRHTPHSCGKCLDGYIGESSGDGNSICKVNLNALESRGDVVTVPMNETCINDEHCMALQSCKGGICVHDNKTCALGCEAGDCTQSVTRGTCVFETISGKPVTTCLANDFTCRTRVVCDAGYFGISCSETLQTIRSKQSTRLKLIMSMNSTMQYEDSSMESIENRAALVYDLGSNPSELLYSSCILLQSVVGSILLVAKNIGDVDTVVEQLVVVLDNCLELYAEILYELETTGQSDRLPLKSISDIYTSASVNRDLRSDGMSLISESMMTGQNDKAFADGSHSRSVVSKTASTIAVTQNIPQTQLENFFNEKKSVVYFEGMIGYEGASHSVLLEENNALLEPNGSQYTSNSLRVKYTLTTSTGIAVIAEPIMTLVIRNREPQSYITNETNNRKTFVTRCAPHNRTKEVNYTCPDGNMVYHRCNGRYESIESTCAALLFLPVCYGISSPPSLCKLVSFTDSNVTCNCTLTMDTQSMSLSNGIGRLAKRTIESTGYVEMAAMTEYTFEGFVTTLSEVDDLTFADVENGIIVLLMFTTLWGGGFLGLLEIARGRHSKSVSPLSDMKSSKRTSNISLAENIVDIEAKKKYLTRYVEEILPVAFQNRALSESWWQSAWRTIRCYHPYAVIFTAKGPGATDVRIRKGLQMLTIQAMLLFIMALFFDLQFPEDQEFCSAFDEESECIAESSMFDHSISRCRWVNNPISPTNYYCLYEEVGMSIQVIILVSVLIGTATAPINIFVDALFEGILAAPLADEYKVELQTRHLRKQYGEKVSNVVSALRGAVRNSVSLARNPLSVVSRSVPAAEEKLETELSLANKFLELVALPDVSTRSFPPSVRSSHALTSVVISNVLGDTWARTRESRILHRPQSLHSDTEHRGISKISPEMSQSDNNAIIEDVEKNGGDDSSFTAFRAQFLQQNKQLHTSTRKTFQDHWGFDPVTQTWGEAKCAGETDQRRLKCLPNGIFNRIKINREHVLAKSIENVRTEALKQAKRLHLATDMQIGLEILHYFIIDLLGRNSPAARIFNSMVDEDFKHSIVVTRFSKGMAWAAVVLINVFFVFFTVVRGMTSSVKWQQTFLVGAILQMLIEIFVFETVECLWIHLTIPRLVRQDVSAAISTVNEAINLAFENTAYAGPLDTPKYFFVSRKLAEMFPSSFESSVVLSFQSYFPPSDLDLVHDAYSGAPNVTMQHENIGVQTFLRRFNLSIVVMTLLRALGTVPIRVQQVVLHTLQPIILSFMVLLVLYIQRHPILILIPLSLLVYEGVAQIWKSKLKTKVVPVINDARRNSRFMEACAKASDERQRVAYEEAADDLSAMSRKQELYENVGKKFVFSAASTCNVIDGRGSVSGVQQWSKNDSRAVEKTTTTRLSNDDPTLTTMGEIIPKREILLVKKLKAANDAIEKLLIRNCNGEIEAREVELDINSDEFKYLYEPRIHSFVDQNGILISESKIMAQRLHAQEIDGDKYDRMKKIVLDSVSKKEAQLHEWDNYRMYKSIAILPFVDSCGQIVSEDKIKWRRSNVTNFIDGDNKNKSSFSAATVTELDLLMLEKQQCEYELSRKRGLL